MQLRDSTLWKQKSWCGGQWIDARSGETMPVVNPGTQAQIGTITNCAEIETAEAIDAAAEAFLSWSKTSPVTRADALFDWHKLILENKEDLALILSTEQGKPLSEALGEITIGAAYLRWYSEEVRRVYGDVILTPMAGKQPLTIRQPLGVAAAITPWNFPSSMVTRKVGAMIGAGCTVVLKPDHQTPYSALALAELAQRVGIPAGVLNVIVGAAEPIGKELCANPKVRALSFTGSTRVGKLLYAQCASTMKKTQLELGGNAPFIVFADADMDQAIQGAVASKFRNSGQTCICANRFLVEESIQEEFVSRLAKALEAMPIGIGTEPGTMIGPLITERAKQRMEELIDDAVRLGAKIRYGGKPSPVGPQFFTPTILTGMTPEMRVFREEIFGPIAPVQSFSSEEEAYALANATEFGLGGYVYTQNLGRAWRAAAAIETGIVGVNEGLVTICEAPFGGVKQSGFGREGSHYGLDAYMDIKYVLFGGIA